MRDFTVDGTQHICNDKKLEAISLNLKFLLEKPNGHIGTSCVGKRYMGRGGTLHHGAYNNVGYKLKDKIVEIYMTYC